MATFADEMKQEYRIGARVVQRHDFIEGVRAGEVNCELSA